MLKCLKKGRSPQSTGEKTEARGNARHEGLMKAWQLPPLVALWRVS